MSNNRPKHPEKPIELAIQYAENLGWRVEKAGPRAHAWGRLYCPQATRTGCIISVWSTPRNADNHARQIRKSVDQCPHQSIGDDSP